PSPTSARDRHFTFTRGRLPGQHDYAGTRDRVSDEGYPQRTASAPQLIDHFAEPSKPRQHLRRNERQSPSAAAEPQPLHRRTLLEPFVWLLRSALARRPGRPLRVVLRQRREPLPRLAEPRLCRAELASPL